MSGISRNVFPVCSPSTEHLRKNSFPVCSVSTKHLRKTSFPVFCRIKSAENTNHPRKSIDGIKLERNYDLELKHDYERLEQLHKYMDMKIREMEAQKMKSIQELGWARKRAYIHFGVLFIVAVVLENVYEQLKAVRRKNLASKARPREYTKTATARANGNGSSPAQAAHDD